ncbi:MAG: sensor histidine kinase, partial [Pseudonocardiaceae bacterium]
HHMSVVAVQAETAPYRLPDVAPAAAEEFAAIARTSRSALDEMRALLGALRADGEADHAPQPTVRDVPELIDSVRRAGTPVSLDLDGEAGELPPVRSLAVHRIVQEALSNAVKHAPGEPVAVRITREPAAVRVEVRNQVCAQDGAVTGPGLGVRGMRERAELLGGTLSAGRVDGAFLVRACIPLSGAGGVR